jgi:hypothetical protein
MVVRAALCLVFPIIFFPFSLPGFDEIIKTKHNFAARYYRLRPSTPVYHDDTCPQNVQLTSGRWMSADVKGNSATT